MITDGEPLTTLWDFLMLSVRVSSHNKFPLISACASMTDDKLCLK